jgi:hypothetical protein
VVTLPSEATGSTQAAWRLDNRSGIDRVLQEVRVGWHLPTSSGRWLETLYRDGSLLWPGRTNVNEAVIVSGWDGSADLVWHNYDVSDLFVNFDFSVTGGNQLRLTTRWLNTGGGSQCTSGPVTVTR